MGLAGGSVAVRARTPVMVRGFVGYLLFPGGATVVDALPNIAQRQCLIYVEDRQVNGMNTPTLPWMSIEEAHELQQRTDTLIRTWPVRRRQMVSPRITRECSASIDRWGPL